MRESSANIALDNGKLQRIREDSRDRRMGLRPKLVTEAASLSVVIGCGSVEIGYCERVVLKIHPDVPPVRRKNSA